MSDPAASWSPAASALLDLAIVVENPVLPDVGVVLGWLTRGLAAVLVGPGAALPGVLVVLAWLDPRFAAVVAGPGALALAHVLVVIVGSNRRFTVGFLGRLVRRHFFTVDAEAAP